MPIAEAKATKKSAHDGHINRIKGLSRSERNAKVKILKRGYDSADATDAEDNDKIVIVRMRVNPRRWAKMNPGERNQYMGRRRDELLAELSLGDGHERVVFFCDEGTPAKSYLQKIAQEFDIDLT